MATNRLVQRKKERFLDRFRELASISATARVTKISRMEHYRWLKEDAEYAKQFATAQEVAADALEDEAIRRAKEGTEKPVFYQGKRVAKIREYSDTLLIFLLKGARPNKYRDGIQVPVKGDGENAPTGIVWVAGNDESSTEKPDHPTASDGSIN